MGPESIASADHRDTFRTVRRSLDRALARPKRGASTPQMGRILRRALPLAMTLLLVAAAAAGCSRRVEPPAGSVLYVSDEDGGYVAVVDPLHARVVARVPVGKRPRALKLSPDGKWLYVALSGSPRTGPGIDPLHVPPPDRSADGIGLVDVASRKLVGTYQVGQDPESFDLSPDGRTLYVSNEETAEMTVLDVSSGAVLARVKVGREPEGVTIRPDGKVVFVTSEQDDEVAAIDTATFAVLAHMATGSRPRSVVLTNDGFTAFVTDELGGAITVLDASRFKVLGSISIRQDSTTPTGPRPMGAVLSIDGQELYVSSGRGGSVAVIDLASRKQVRSIDGVGNRPWGIALSPDGTRLYTANGTSHDLSIVNIATGNVDRRIYIGGLPWGVAVGAQPRALASAGSARSCIANCLTDGIFAVASPAGPMRAAVPAVSTNSAARRSSYPGFFATRIYPSVSLSSGSIRSRTRAAAAMATMAGAAAGRSQ
ncbi:MAG: beta-propeller fold lactonase family protein [Polyangiaceae bacterium]|jgi:YVTN family beta-propeller protein